MATETQTDTDLLEAARGGDQTALEQLLERHQARVYRFGMQLCRDPQDAQDVLQETLLTMARGVRDFRGASSISTWLFTIARSFCIKHRRRSTFTPEETSLETSAAEATALADPARAPDEALIGKQLEQALEQAIRALEPKYREVLLLRDIEGLTAPEVAEILELSVPAVKSRLHRARAAVRDSVAPMLGIPIVESATPGTCPDVSTLFSEHLEEPLSPEVCREMERHLDGCAHCRGTCEALKSTLALCRTSAPAAEVPPEVQRAVKASLKAFLRA